MSLSSQQQAPRLSHVLLVLLVGIVLVVPVAADTGSSRLARDLDAILQSGTLAGARLGAVVLRPGKREPLYARGARLALAPASNMKILTSLAALGLLGPERRFETELLSLQAPDDHGVLSGPLWVRGAGDPSLVGESWWLMARELRMAGVREIEGGLVADTSLFGGPRPRGWGTACDRPYCAPFEALMANFSSIEVRVFPGPRPGTPARVELFPLACGLEIDNQARTVQGSGSRLDVAVVPGGEVGRVTVGGTLGASSNATTTYRPVPAAAAYALGCLRDALSREEIAVGGTLRTGIVPAGTRVLASHRSRPLHAIVSDMNKYSNNVMAESLVKLLDDGIDAPRTTESGLARLEEHLRERGVDTEGWQLADGSGLSSQGRVTALGIAGALRAALEDPALGPEMVASLAVGGDVGTLSDRLLASGRRIRAKTGRISGVASLSGYVYPADGRQPLIFAFILNGPQADGQRARQALDRACLRLLQVGPAESPATPVGSP